MSTYLITGTSRGIGLTMASHLASKPASEVSTVFAAARTETGALKQLIAQSSGRVQFIKIDVVDQESVKKAAAEVDQALGDKGLDVLINNVGLMPFTPDGIETMTDLESTFTVNVTSAHLVSSAFLPLLKRGQLKKVANISTTLGSMAMSQKYSIFPVPAYKIAKAALNMLTLQYGQSFAKDGFIFVSISPGWVKTDLGGDQADLTADQSATGVLEVISKVTNAETGKFFNVRVPGWEKAEGLNQYDGAEAPW